MDTAERHALDSINRIVMRRQRPTCHLWICPEAYCGHQETAPGQTRFCPECGCEMGRTPVVSPTAYRFVTCPHCDREFQRIDFHGARHNITCDTEKALAELYAASAPACSPCPLTGYIEVPNCEPRCDDCPSAELGPQPIPDDYRIWKGTVQAFFDDAANRSLVGLTYPDEDGRPIAVLDVDDSGRALMERDGERRRLNQ